MSRRYEIQVGLTVLASLVVLGWGVLWLRGYQASAKTKVWHVSFPQTGGLGEGDEVQVNGIRMGSVKQMQLRGDHVIVDLMLDERVVVTRDSRVIVRNVGLMGEKVIGVDLRATGAPWTERDTIPGEYEKGIPEVMGDVALTIESVSELTDQLTKLAGTADRKGDVTAALANVRQASDELRLTLSDNRRALSSAVTDFAATARTTRQLTAGREAQLARTIDHFSSSAEKLDRLSGRLDSLQMVLTSVTRKIDRGDGTLGQLVNDRKLYTNMAAMVDTMRALIADVKKNPKKYFKVEIF